MYVVFSCFNNTKIIDRLSLFNKTNYRYFVV